ncbi:MAG: hypothetical protein JXB00_10195 [Bacteroidales bacterium]|nr:hypothetical protein [Bacteroidales bacterium]
MKKTKIYFVLLILATAFLFNSCKKDEPKTLSCEELSTLYVSAWMTFSLSPTKANCEAAKKATNDLLNGCALLSPADKADYQEELDDLDCTEYE